jgi:hypothetical protein
MKPCDRWREELAEHALGAAASHALKEHLGACSVCSRALREWKARMGRVDEAVRQRAAVEPRPESVSRLLARVQEERSRGWLAARTWQWAAAGALAAVAAISVFGAREYLRRKETRRVYAAAAAISKWNSPTGSLLQVRGETWRVSPLKLGGYFYQPNAMVPEKEREKP